MDTKQAWKFGALLALITATSGCATAINKQQALYDKHLEPSVIGMSLETAQRKSSVTCSSKLECAQAFHATKAFVQDNGDMKIEVLTGMMITTIPPFSPSFVGLSAQLTYG